uniref:DUF1206 domain-containing protein n=1 Tax=Ningiella ruwaisensis TaxID=2364274 RepID=UPI0010A0389A|nr:DUF1206 domain-containing protein [Ningiella ruwaisensis]
MDVTKSDIFETFATAGYSSKCIVYAILGILMIAASLTALSTEELSKTSVFEEILSSPFGTFLLIAIIAGLIAYVLWRIVQGVSNPLNLDMSEPKNVFMRIFYFLSAAIYISITIAAINVLIGSQKNSGDSKEQLSSTIMEQTWGVWLVGALGLGVAFFALIQLKHAFTTDFKDKFDEDIGQAKLTYAVNFGRAGFAARGILYGLIGSFFVHAALTYDPDEAGGLGQAISLLLEQPFGPWLAAIVGLGMICFGVFCGFESGYRKVRK